MSSKSRPYSVIYFLNEKKSRTSCDAKFAPKMCVQKKIDFAEKSPLKQDVY